MRAGAPSLLFLRTTIARTRAGTKIAHFAGRIERPLPRHTMSSLVTQPKRASTPTLPAGLSGEEEPRPAKKIRLETLEVELENAEEPETVQEPTERKGKQQSRKTKSKKKKSPPLPDPCSGPDVLYQEIRQLLGPSVADAVTERGEAFTSPYKTGDEVLVRIEVVGSGGSGIGRVSETDAWAIVVPKALPGELVRVRIARWERMYSLAQVVEVVEPSPWRDESLIGCRYFSKCGGCQYQMISYEKQLELKREVVVRAYERYSKLTPESIPPIAATIGSPLTYAYRTKLTPHFERAPKWATRDETKKAAIQTSLDAGIRPEWLTIGFEEAVKTAGGPPGLDIEECPIATSVINDKYAEDRKKIVRDIFTYKKGVSLMYRDSLDPSIPIEKIQDPNELSEAFRKHVCVTDQKRGIARELVGDKGHLFEFAAGGFFQNNNSILGRLVGYVQESVLDLAKTGISLTHLVDTYCGTGLFAITLSPYFSRVAGIEISSQAIENATRNAEINKSLNERLRGEFLFSPSASTDISFRSGDASDIFSSVTPDFPAANTVVIIDPPRKGCDQPFLDQLVAFKPEVVVYVSCNVHTQARDVGWLVGGDGGESRARYRLEKLVGFDLFPQTAHVESVAVLRLCH